MTAGVTVIVTLDEKVDASTYSGMTVFVIARPAEVRCVCHGREPHTIGEWPLTVRLSDANSMAGQSLSALSAVDLRCKFLEMDSLV